MSCVCQSSAPTPPSVVCFGPGVPDELPSHGHRAAHRPLRLPQPAPAPPRVPYGVPRRRRGGRDPDGQHVHALPNLAGDNVEPGRGAEGGLDGFNSWGWASAKQACLNASGTNFGAGSNMRKACNRLLFNPEPPPRGGEWVSLELDPPPRGPASSWRGGSLGGS